MLCIDICSAKQIVLKGILTNFSHQPVPRPGGYSTDALHGLKPQTLVKTSKSLAYRTGSIFVRGIDLGENKIPGGKEGAATFSQDQHK